MQDLWPGFTAATTPVEFFDGTNTWLLNHPAPPDGFRPMAGVPGVYLYRGQHESIRANTGTKLNGIPTATADFSHSTASADEQAATLIHEAFHVFEAKSHPDWAANEADLFTYPAGDAELLSLRRLETAALVRALHADDPACQAAGALSLRARRFQRLPAASVAYERAVERTEGLAQYVEFRATGKAPALTHADFPPDAAMVRQRAYATGQAWALLLDRLEPTWKGALTSDQPPSLDELLARHRFYLACASTKEEAQAALAQAREDVAVLQKSLATRKQEFLAAGGTRLEIVAGNAPLFPRAFDPWNVVILSPKEVLHSRWLKLSNASGEIEVLGRASLTESAGAHPLFNGVRQLTITGLKSPQISSSAGKITIEGDGIKGTLTGTLEGGLGLIRIRLP